MAAANDGKKRAQPLISKFFQKMRPASSPVENTVREVAESSDATIKSGLPLNDTGQATDTAQNESIILDSSDDDGTPPLMSLSASDEDHVKSNNSIKNSTSDDIEAKNVELGKEEDLNGMLKVQNYAFVKSSSSNPSLSKTTNNVHQDRSQFHERLFEILGSKNKRKLSVVENDEDLDLSDKGNISNPENESTPQSTSRKVKKPKKSNDLTPLEQQIKEIKLQNMDKIIAVQVGYKYKFFAQDAVIVSQILHNMLLPGKLTIDETNPQDKYYKKFAYCSIPDNRLHIHLQKLLHYNLKVGVVEQVETQAIRDAGQGSKLKNVFERKLTNVFTKATYNMNENFGKTNSGSFSLKDASAICALVIERQSEEITTSSPTSVTFYLVSIELDTGLVTHDTFTDSIKFLSKLETRLKHLNPSEVVHNDSLDKKIKNYISKMNENTTFYAFDDTEIESLAQQVNSADVSNMITTQNLEKPFKLLYMHLESFNLQNSLLNLSPKTFQAFESTQHMNLQANVLTNLEIFENNTEKDTLKGTLLWVLDHTRTSYGFAKLQHWISHPLVQEEKINARLDAIECISQEVFNIFFESLNNWLNDSQNKNLLRTLNRIKYGKTSKKEIYYYLKNMNSLRQLFKKHDKYLTEQVYDKSCGRVALKSELLTDLLTFCDESCSHLHVEKYLNMINVEAVFHKSNEPDDEHFNFFNLNNYDNSQEILLKQRDVEGVKHDLQDELKNIRKVLHKPMCEFKDEVDYLIEVRNSLVDKIVPPDWVKVSSTKMVSRFKTPNVAILLKKLQLEKDLLHQVTENEYFKFLQRINDEYDQVFAILDNLAVYDCILSLSSASYSNDNYCRPKFTSSKSQHINIVDGRNPIIETMMLSGDSYVCNDVHMGVGNNQIMVVTGPNMGGKSSYIKQVALLVIMAQIGCFVPCSFMEISIFNQRFKWKFLDILQILNNFGRDSLLLLDEVGRGTGTTDGMSISYSILKYFIDLRDDCPLVLFITHFHSIIKKFHNDMLGIFHMSFYQDQNSDDTDITFLYKLTKGYMNKSFGMNVAKLASIDGNIIERARSISESLQLENESNKDIYTCQKIMHILFSMANAKNSESWDFGVSELQQYISDM
ncbi:hypothetical protein ACO0QE_000848 [Hanseniaspora vineae]